MKFWRLKIGIYAVVWSLIIGMLTAAYLNLVNWVIDLVWHQYLDPAVSSKWYPFLVCIPLGFLIGFLNERWGNYPLTIEQVLTQVRLKGQLNYHNWWKSFILGLLSLGAGGSIGPEASTTVLTSSMINWLGDRMRWATSMRQKVSLWYGKMQTQDLARAPRFSQLFKNKSQRVFVISGLVGIGIVGAAIVFKLFPEEGVFGMHHRIINWEWINLLTSIPTIIIGIAFGWLFVHLENWAALIINAKISKIWQGGIFGLILAISSLITSDILFSGEFRIVPFTHEAFNHSIIFLLVVALVKAVMSNLGFAMGWRGGTIFPAIFSSVAVGTACAMMLPGDVRINAIVVIAASLTFILEKPLLTIILLLLLVPIELAPVIIVVAFLVGRIIKLFPASE
ncbi:chloride channel protein [Lactobacillus reuteri]|uniref:chloride channel protein n=1 Tax=Limosilactobacillus reuteri TaxID=1598 RepID=UPI00143DD971|nr:chloride channel protein [Limosilactobacillus reuteri]MBC6910720.1 chloride channel protein [Limosilactobacillus reuteri]MCC4499695.1 chloride channel protein [Limosilactobacillus reuteri]MCC4504031.1 chloride channel protein [Limosilactobacillus reuteri]MCC4506861.1 chloride channel protein [Limosilactobacillus reuteri]QIZ03512.1 chloride channel protein [Limosilactobacillus reuteri]